MKKIAIVGAGVVGCALARELAKREAEIVVFEKGSDVASGASKANSGIAHAGFDALPRTNKARLNVRGAALLPGVSRELDFPYRANGALVLAFREEERAGLEELLGRGRRNGVEGLRILSGDEAKEREPSLGNVAAALYAPTSAIVSPYEMTVALAENAAANGVTFRRNTAVVRFARQGEKVALVTKEGEERFDAVVNAAGLGAAELDGTAKIVPRRGQYLLTDKQTLVRSTLFRLPTERGKGILVAPTTHGNVLLGPTAETVDGNDTSTTEAGLEEIFRTARESVPSIDLRSVITEFSGVRATPVGGDFLLGRSEVKGVYRAAGIDSPGLTAAPAIAEELAALLSADLGLGLRSGFVSERRAIPRFSALTDEERRALVAADPRYGRVVCRCETVTEGEIVEAIRRVPGATDLDGVKRRTRAGMGRCQSGFCTVRVAEILARELGVPFSSVTKKGTGSEIAVGANKEGL